MCHRTITTGKILRSGYLGNHCHGNQKTFTWLISHLKSNWFLKGMQLVWKETVTMDFCYHGNHHVVIATKNLPLCGMICERESVHIHFFLSNSYTLMLCCVSEPTPLTRPSERVKALVQYRIGTRRVDGRFMEWYQWEVHIGHFVRFFLFVVLGLGWLRSIYMYTGMLFDWKSRIVHTKIAWVQSFHLVSLGYV